MILRIIRWLRGYVLFTVSGRFPERFINLLNKNGVRYWNMIPSGKGYKASMTVQDYLRVRPMARTCGVRLRSVRKSGLPYFIKKYKHRQGLLIGAVCAVLIMSVLNQFIWVIDISGTERTSEQSVLSALKSSGLEVGAYKGSLDFGSVARNSTVLLPDVGRMSVNAINNVAQVEIREKSQSPELSNETDPCNIKASQDGVITKTVVSKGSCLVKKGSAVVRNQLLVSAVVEGKTEDIDLTYVHSTAKIFADVNESKSFSVRLAKKNLVADMNYSEKSRINFLCFSVPFKTDFSQRGESVSIFRAYRLAPCNVTLPLGITRQRQYYFNESGGKINKKEAKIILQKKIAVCECFSYHNNKVQSKAVTYTEKTGKLSARVDYVINKNIALSQKIKVSH